MFDKEKENLGRILECPSLLLRCEHEKTRIFFSKIGELLTPALVS